MAGVLDGQRCQPHGSSYLPDFSPRLKGFELFQYPGLGQLSRHLRDFDTANRCRNHLGIGANRRLTVEDLQHQTGRHAVLRANIQDDLPLWREADDASLQGIGATYVVQHIVRDALHDPDDLVRSLHKLAHCRVDHGGFGLDQAHTQEPHRAKARQATGGQQPGRQDLAATQGLWGIDDIRSAQLQLGQDFIEHLAFDYRHSTTGP